MRTSVRFLIATLFSIGAIGCVSQVQSTRAQKPFYEPPTDQTPTEIALVSVQVPDWVAEEAPASDPPVDLLEDAIPRAFDGSKFEVADRTAAGYTLTFDGPSGPSVPPDREFRADAPGDVPSAITAPLLLGVQVVGWSEGETEHRGSSVRVVHTDVAYSLWTRDGKHVETRRVRLSLVPGQAIAAAPRFVPNRAVWLQRTWRDARDSYPTYAPDEESELFRTAAAVNARAFAFPFATHRVTFSAQLAGGSSLKQGNERMKDEDWEGAYRAFERIAERDGTAGAYYNMGVVREIQGRTDEAISHYETAVSIDDKPMYRRQLEAARRRQKVDQQLVIPELPAPPSADQAGAPDDSESPASDRPTNDPSSPETPPSDRPGDDVDRPDPPQ